MLALTGPRRREKASTDRLRLVVIDELSATGEQPLHLPEPHDDRLLAVTKLVEEDLSTPSPWLNSATGSARVSGRCPACSSRRRG